MAKKAAVRLWHRARDFDRGTHQPGHHGGAVGHTALASAACADFRLPQPPHRPPGSVLRGDRGQGRRLHPHGRHGDRPGCATSGILNWVRRCAESWRDGRFVLEQETNAYARAAQVAVEGLPATPRGPGSALARYVGRHPCAPCPQRSLRRPWQRAPVGQVQALAADPMARLNGCPGKPGAWLHRPPNSSGLPECNRCRETKPESLTTSLMQRPAGWSIERKKVANEQGAVGGGLCPMNKRTGWENEATTRAINAEPWEPMPGMVKRQCPECRYWFAAPANRAIEPRCQDCVEKLPRGRQR